MSLPQPKVPLEDICTVLFNNTLYAYSSKGFQSLTLDNGAEWEELPAGQSVTGGVCVGSTPKDSNTAAFYVVGGQGTDKYTGLQRFTYATGKWEEIKPDTLVTQDRRWHGATYLSASDSILVYAGTQTGVKSPTSHTFTIRAAEPHTVASYPSDAPPTIDPIVLAWSESEAVLLGGNDRNQRITIFNPANGPNFWTDSLASLASPLPKDLSAIKASITNGDDGSKSLYTFDMTVSPNQLNRTLLINGQGQPVPNSAPVPADTKGDAGSKPGSARKRADAGSLTADAWPAYDSALVSNTIRSQYAIADDGRGMVVIAGGSTDDPLCVFDGRENAWQNVTAMLASRDFQVKNVPGSTSTNPDNAASTSASTQTGAATSKSSTDTSQSSHHLGTGVILGIALGSLAAIALLLALIYICMRRRHRRKTFIEAGHARRASGFASPEKGGFGYASDSLPHGPVKGTFRGHQTQDSKESFSSVAVLTKRQNQDLKRNNSKDSQRSSSSSMFNRAFKSTISKPIPQMSHQDISIHAPAQFSPQEPNGSYGVSVAQPRPRPREIERQGSLRRSSGWNRYWSGGSALNILGFGGSNNSSNNNVNSKRATMESRGSSHYSDPRSAHRITQDSATVPPLRLQDMPAPGSRPRFDSVNSGSPRMSHYDNRVHDGIKPQIERPASQNSNKSGYSSGIPASVHDSWDPAFSKPWGSDRTPSSAYSNSFTAQLAAPITPTRPQHTRAPSGISTQPQLATAAFSSDMSWLNLGDAGRGR